MHPLRRLAATIPLLVVTCSGALLFAAENTPRPNILVAISDDQSFPYAGAYGDKTANTPAFDWIAQHGVLFTNGFCASPGCSPSRAALLTGRHVWQLEQAGTHDSTFPRKFAVYPDLLERAGYHVGYTGKGWGPGNFQKDGWPHNPAGNPYGGRKLKSPEGIHGDDYAANFADFLDAQPQGAPFYFWYGGHEPHRKYEKGSGHKAGKDPAEANVPAFLPDTPEIRSDLLDHVVEIEWFDSHLQKMLDLLRARGQLENTLIVVTADNGMPFPRAKANCYEYGIHVPLAIAWPARVPGGRTVTDLVGFVDIAPTLLSAASVDVPSETSGRGFLDVLLSDKSGRVDESRTRILVGRERHSSARYDNLGYPIRALRTDDYLYIRNFRPDRWPAGDPSPFGPDPYGYYDIDDSPSKAFLIHKRDQPAVAPFFHLAVDKRPAEELFDIRTDPGNLRNLIDEPAHAEMAKSLREQLETELRATGDPRILDGGDVYETYPRNSRKREFPKPE